MYCAKRNDNNTTGDRVDRRSSMVHDNDALTMVQFLETIKPVEQLSVGRKQTDHQFVRIVVYTWYQYHNAKRNVTLYGGTSIPTYITSKPNSSRNTPMIGIGYTRKQKNLTRRKQYKMRRRRLGTQIPSPAEPKQGQWHNCALVRYVKLVDQSKPTTTRTNTHRR